jgi:hypothetical protein
LGSTVPASWTLVWLTAATPPVVTAGLAAEATAGATSATTAAQTTVMTPLPRSMSRPSLVCLRL